MIEITLDDALRLLTEAVEEKGEDYVYSNNSGERADTEYSIDCQYVHVQKGEFVPGCGVGNALHRAGVSLDWLSDHESYGARNVLGMLRDDGILTANRTVEEFLSAFQSRQDRGDTWGESLRMAREYVGL